MKKFLALVLALVMTMSLVTISAGAEFTDADEVTYDEAVEVMTALGVVTGDTAGAFNPTAGLTRGAAAKIICNMILGVEVAGALEAQVAPFADVATSNVFAGYIAFCKEEGIIGGYPDGTFKPAEPLTGYAFLKMLLGALGYDADVEGFNGSNYAINVAKIAKQRGLTDGNEDYVGSKAITREEAMLYAFNTMISETVIYSGGSNTVINIGDVEIKQTGTAAYDTNPLFYKASFGKLALEDVTSVAPADNGKLEWTATGSDDYGRQAYSWFLDTTSPATTNAYNKNTDTLIGEYAAAADYTVVATKAAKSIEYWVETIDKDYDAAGIVMNGASAATAATTLDLGDTLEVYLDDNGDVSAVVVVKTDLAQIVKVTAVANKDYKYTVKVGTKTYTDEELPGFDAETMVKDTFVLVNYKGNTSDVLNIEVAPYVTGARTAFGSGYVKVDGVKYETTASYNASTDPVSGDSMDNVNTFNFFLDNNGYVVGYEQVTDETVADGYVYVIGSAFQAYNAGTLGLGGDAAAVKVKVAYMDGTVATENYEILKATDAITVASGNAISDGSPADTTSIDKDDYYVEFCGAKYEVGSTNMDTANTDIALGFYTYTKNEAGEIKLAALDTDVESAITIAASTNGIVKDDVTFKDGSANTWRVNSDTKLVVVDKTNAKVSEFVGYTNFPSTELASKPALVVHAKDSTIATAVYVVDTATYSNDITYAYYTGDSESVGTKTYYNFYMGGELKTFELSSAPGATVVNVNEAGKSTNTTGFSQGTVIVTETDAKFFVGSNGTTYTYADDVEVWDVSVEDVVTEGAVAEGDSVIYVLNTSTSKVDAVYVIENVVAAQPETNTEALAAIVAAGGTGNWLDMAEIVSLELGQTQDGNTIYLSGELTAFNAESLDGDTTDEATADQKAALLNLFGITDFASAVSAYAEIDAGESFAFVMVDVNDSVHCMILAEDTTDGVVGALSGTTTATVTVGGINVVIDFAGLSF